MRDSRLLLLLSFAALFLGSVWPLAGSNRHGAIRVTPYEIPQPAIDAREPFLSFPGPVLRWSGSSGISSLRWGKQGWERQPTSESDSVAWQSGSWTPGKGLALATAQISATSLRNGVLRDAEGKLQGWSPDRALDTSGRQHLVFDRFSGDSYDVVYRDPKTLQEVVVASSSANEAHATIALDVRERVWIAWDEASEMWGKGAGLHESRTLRLVMRDGDGWHQVALPDLATLLNQDGQAASPFPGFAELPRLVVEPQGGVWLFYRVMRPFTERDSPTASRRIAWVIRAMQLTTQGWTAPVTLPQSDGPNHDTMALLGLPEGGVLAAWTADGRLQHFAALKVWGEPVMVHTTLHTARIENTTQHAALGASVPGLQSWSLASVEQKPSSAPLEHDPNPAFGPAGFVRLWGDLHRHSDLSRCSMDTDGSVPDQYRYAAGPGGLDFVAVTDHHQHLTPSYWEFLLDTTERFHDETQLTTLFGFEYAFPDGHRNLICAERSVAVEAPLLSFAGAQLDLFDAKDFIAIPHQIAESKTVLDWSVANPELETQMEIYQRRGSYEERGGLRTPRRAVQKAKFVQDYLKEGKRFGLIASSDHQFSQGAFAVVYARGRDRGSVMEALRARRSYAATAKIALHVQLGELLMGAEGAVAQNASLQVAVDAGAPLARVEVIRNGELVHSWHGESLMPPKQEGLLTLRFGKIPNRDSFALSGKNVLFGAAMLMDGEQQEACIQPSTDPWNSAMVLLYASQRPQSLGGWVIPMMWWGPLEEVEVSLGDGPKSPSWKGSELVQGSEWRKKYWNKPVSLRLAPAPLREFTLQQSYQPQDWMPGEWVYVRVVRMDGAMAWSSPIWVDQVTTHKAATHDTPWQTCPIGLVPDDPRLPTTGPAPTLD